MIKLSKRSKPDVLERNAAAWTKELLEALTEGNDISISRKNRYNNKEIKDALLIETSEKCAYCESKFRHVTYGDIEHVVPKDSSPELSYEWRNMTIACDTCNTNKGTKIGFIDPYVDTPSEHLKFRGPMVTAMLGSEAGRLSVVVLDLNRTPLIERRRDKIEELHLRLGEILQARDTNVRVLLAEALLNYARNDQEQFSACASDYISQMKAEGQLPAELI